MRAAFIRIHHHDRINTIEILFDGISILSRDVDSLEGQRFATL